MIDGKTLIGWGFKPGPWFASAISAANIAKDQGADEVKLREVVSAHMPPPPIEIRAAGELPFFQNIEEIDEGDAGNIASVRETMTELMRTPTIKGGAFMPDACPTGPVGQIPVGGVVVTENAIHPGFHSADICCSVAISVIGDVDPKLVLDEAQRLTHFGGGGRGKKRLEAPKVLEEFAGNQFLVGLEDAGHDHFGTQGDGNHFLFVGRMKSTGDVALVTHHGSRKPGAMLYKRGMTVAQRHTAKVSPETMKGNAWIPADTAEGRDYWAALQIIREWTKQNHFAIQDLVAGAIGHMPIDRFWNEHNFIFQKSDGFFYHGKGATPAWDGYAADSSGLTLIPLNMSEPVLITRGLNADHALGFSPHGAGRNWGRKAHVRSLGEHDADEQVQTEAGHIDARWWCGKPDVSELPSAYKRAATVRQQIDSFGLAEIVDEVVPFGGIMAGDWLTDFLAEKRRERNGPGT